MADASFRFHGVLHDFLPRQHRGVAFTHACARAASLKNAIEALGVPHTEVGRLTVNGARATLQRIVREGDAVEVFAKGEELGSDPIFLADAHLGGLARFLRMLGFDTLHDHAFADRDIRRLAHEERRIVLSRDRELLKCREIARGCYVHALKAEAQLREVAERYGLAARARPFTRCLRCNFELRPVAKAEIEDALPPKVRETQERFVRCEGCGRIYWPGSHYARMRAALGDLLGA
ncbi:MAG: Mut7-C ubiquitin/RNAse domain-containing protein [Betaproteobacteria bacterium]|nr:Mut7-C ubiquitin/RNAse domain-containing protein [Betaproteobacteria bacterium]MDH5221563.1 Mut7-C ubiquitin/RNAse domain-containing protein [Betaproteobacteria bacterium]MDH5350077.1 Mut7-C ubiquitin/RNAse domain-containing protein [Betaproteobacteria bacterium]